MKERINFFNSNLLYEILIKRNKREKDYFSDLPDDIFANGTTYKVIDHTPTDNQGFTSSLSWAWKRIRILSLVVFRFIILIILFIIH